MGTESKINLNICTYEVEGACRVRMIYSKEENHYFPFLK